VNFGYPGKREKSPTRDKSTQGREQTQINEQDRLVRERAININGYQPLEGTLASAKGFTIFQLAR
jgi:hypothetical protein